MEDDESDEDKNSMKSEEDTIEENFIFGSKKRMYFDFLFSVVNNGGDIEVLSLSGSTKALEDFGLDSAKKSLRKVPVSK